ncbi:MAG: polynucleotide adenylyltransferase PcnB [Spirochaetales bacterium]|nr:polynucleotide adenylyltransferase PcnB [Spirochaetales bacterium]
MLIRYGTDSKGKRVKIAEIYTADEHKIDQSLIDREALKIIRRLRSSGHEAYLVGGAVRDLLVGKVPKDFDIATDALPRKVKNLFRNSRIIGRRFRLVHVFYGEKIIEVSTFRSNEPGGENNVYGSLEDDVTRRDFSLNALYYSPKEEWVLDYIGGVKDIENKKMRSLIPLETTFIEDPVRLIRAIKYSANTDCTIPFKMKRSIKKFAPNIAGCPSSRLTEEIFKILQCGNSAGIFNKLEYFGIFDHLLPVIYQTIKDDREKKEGFYNSLKEMDDKIGSGQITRANMLAVLVEPVIDFDKDLEVNQPLFMDTYKEMKRILTPLTPPNHDVEVAVRNIFKAKGLKPPKRPRKRYAGRYNSRKPRAGTSKKSGPAITN